MTAAALVLAAALAASAARPVPDLRAARHPAAPAADSRCDACHTEEGWNDLALFAHERTGFPLEGRHLQAGCRACHPQSFAAPVGGACVGCHRDPHAGEHGAQCGSCHDSTSWASSFGADAHRRTSFPLSGRHAFIPCEECHGNRRERGFGRATVECGACHQADYARAGLVSVDHAAAGFGMRCRECHSSWSFEGASFPAHDDCFLLSSGPHAGVRCLACHTQIGGAAVGGCSTGTAACGRCHGCAEATARHQGVLGFECKDQKCYACHRFALP